MGVDLYYSRFGHVACSCILRGRTVAREELPIPHHPDYWRVHHSHRAMGHHWIQFSFWIRHVSALSCALSLIRCIVYMQICVLVTITYFLCFIHVLPLCSWKFVGNLENVFLIGVDYDDCSPHAPTIPAACFAVFMMMFAAITPLLMTGAFAERVRWKVRYITIRKLCSH